MVQKEEKVVLNYNWILILLAEKSCLLPSITFWQQKKVVSNTQLMVLMSTLLYNEETLDNGYVLS